MLALLQRKTLIDTKNQPGGEGGWAQLELTDALSCARSHGDMLWGTIFKGRSAGGFWRTSGPRALIGFQEKKHTGGKVSQPCSPRSRYLASLKIPPHSTLRKVL